MALYGCGPCICLTGLIIRLIALFGLAVAVFFIVANPQKMSAQITDASFTQFNLSEANPTISLQYNLEFNLSLRNPNRIMGLFYEEFGVTGYQQDMFVDSWWTSFYQAPKNTTEMRYAFVGKQDMYMAGNSSEFLVYKARFDEQKSARVFDMDLRGDLSVRVKIGAIKIGKFFPKIQCLLKVPLVTIGMRKLGSTGFNGTVCSVEFMASSLLDPYFKY